MSMPTMPRPGNPNDAAIEGLKSMMAAAERELQEATEAQQNHQKAADDAGGRRADAQRRVSQYRTAITTLES